MGYKIREVREAKKMTQKELAEASGISRTTISQLENGTSRITTTQTLSKIAKALGVSVDKLFFDEGV